MRVEVGRREATRELRELRGSWFPPFDREPNISRSMGERQKGTTHDTVGRVSKFRLT